MSCPPGDSYPRFISNLKISSSKKAISLWPAIFALDKKSVTPSNAGQSNIRKTVFHPTP
jgi:hypothetical protein